MILELFSNLYDSTTLPTQIFCISFTPWCQLQGCSCKLLQGLAACRGAEGTRLRAGGSQGCRAWLWRWCSSSCQLSNSCAGLLSFLKQVSFLPVQHGCTGISPWDPTGAGISDWERLKVLPALPGQSLEPPVMGSACLLCQERVRRVHKSFFPMVSYFGGCKTFIPFVFQDVA